MMTLPLPPRTMAPLPEKPPGAPGQPKESINNRLRSFSRFLPLSTDAGYADLMERSLAPMWSVVCDNYSNQWAYLPDANVYIPPMTDCKVVILRGISDVRAIWQVPNRLTLPQTTPSGAGLYLYFTEEQLQPNPGKDISHWLPV